MAALTEDAARQFQGGPVHHMGAHPVAAATTLFSGGFVGLNAGEARPHTIGDTFVGMAQSHGDNSAGLAGAMDIDVIEERKVVMDVAGAVAASVGADVHALNDNDLALAGGDVIGKVSQFNGGASGIECVVHTRAPGWRRGI